MNYAQTYHIHLSGIVQGVGFRPAVYQLAVEHSLKGYVCNSCDGLHIEFNADKQKATQLLNELITNPPARAYIENCSLNEVVHIDYTDFKIVESSNSTATTIPLTPDFAICSNCLQELTDVNNRRYRYPFITCTQCGPRYSIIQSLPYDRTNTSMFAFEMCDDCSNEYATVTNRRYYSQTNSCEACGIHLSAYVAGKKIISNNNAEALAVINEYLDAGKIVAVKGIGGFLLLCDAGNAESVSLLRKRKHRPAKPLAVMCRDADAVQLLAYCNQTQLQHLQSAVAPVVLLKAKKDIQQHIAFDIIAPGLSSIGLMLPNAPLLKLISSDFTKPLICTSGNISGSPVIYKDEEAVNHLSSIADIVVTHNREILLPQDDSVISVGNAGNTVTIRRSRGMAPVMLDYTTIADRTILCTGALMKSSFTIAHNKNIYVSQFLGNTDWYDAQEMYQHSFHHLLKALKATPAAVVADKHPAYFSSQFAREKTLHYNIPLFEVQHHKAHFAAVLAENELLQHDEKILGVIWDGTGLGDDHNIWGGEFFLYNNNHILRAAHFDYYGWIAGDKMAKEPRLSALAICKKVAEAAALTQCRFNDNEWNIYNAMLQQQQLLLTSSAGRIFDALASLLNVCHKQSYEGEAALLLETIAAAYLNTSNNISGNTYLYEEEVSGSIPVTLMFSRIITDINAGVSAGCIAARFHYTLVQVIKWVAKNNGTHIIAFSGGVFQNMLLLDMIKEELSADFEIFFHRQLSPNDENISFGQMAYYDHNIDNIQLNNGGNAE